MKDIFSFFKKRIDLPDLGEVVYILKIASPKKRILFFVFLLIFILSITTILWKLNNKFSVIVPDEGGVLKEGILGTPRFINPLLAISDADRDMVALIYSGLMRPDDGGGLMLDLAEKYEISEDGTKYTFTLRPDLVWHDGESITSDDVIFTIEQIKDPMLKSPKRASWEGVLVEKIDDKTIVFTLEKPYAPFLENATLGIIPKHLWQKATSEMMSFSDLNINPIGSGPFEIQKIERDSSQIITSTILVPNKKFALGKPYIKKIIINFYSSEEKIINAYKNKEIDSISAISPQIIDGIKRNDTTLKSFYLPRVFGVFFNQNNNKVFSYIEVRQALELATDKNKIINEILNGFGTTIDNPIPPGIFGSLENGESDYSIEKAKEILQKNKWAINKDGVLEKTTGTGKSKETIELKFSISTSNVPELKQVAELTKLMWEQIGAKVDLKIFEIGDLNQNVIRPRKYDALLFGEIVGREPDPFVFWHSSQRNDPGLNIALYANITADKLLEKARITTDDEKRKEIYEKFQEEVTKDIPAVFLYSPHFIYLVPVSLSGINETQTITIPSERFSQIYKWYLETEKIWKIFAK